MASLTAPEEYQRRIHESLQGLKGIEDIVDDILCVGEGDTYESAVKDHERNLIALLERCREKNIKLNSKKLQLRKQEVPYIIDVLTPDNLKPDPSKVKAIVAMPTPSGKKALQRLLGMITYLAKFLANLSDVTEMDYESFACLNSVMLLLGVVSLYVFFTEQPLKTLYTP